jgi:hypothetical protein
MRALVLVIAFGSVAHADPAAGYELGAAASVGYGLLRGLGHNETFWGPSAIVEGSVAMYISPQTTVGLTLNYARSQYSTTSDPMIGADAIFDTVGAQLTLDHHIDRLSLGLGVGPTYVANDSESAFWIGASGRIGYDVAHVGDGRVQLVLGARLEPFLNPQEWWLRSGFDRTLVTISLGVGYRL